MLVALLTVVVSTVHLMLLTVTPFAPRVSALMCEPGTVTTETLLLFAFFNSRAASICSLSSKLQKVFCVSDQTW